MIDGESIFFNHYLTDIMSEKVLSIAPLSGGKNSRVYHVVCDNFREFAVKLYFRDKTDGRDRLRTEWRASHFMIQHGFGNIPKPVAMDEDKGVAVYEFIQGSKLSPAEIEMKSIDALVSFLEKLENLKNDPEADALAPASEACFSIDDMLENVSSRMNRLVKVKKYPGAEKELSLFLNTLIAPFFQEVEAWCYKKSEEFHLNLSRKIEKKDQTLSPSDFGFHNAILSKKGGLYFMDFEYFGWDDPSKMIVDFLLHPAMEIRTELKHYFLEKMLEKFAHIQGLKQRIKIVFPLFGIKWCLILLNEFIPSENKRREFAAGDHRREDPVFTGQLNKSIQMYGYVKETYKEFCHG